VWPSTTGTSRCTRAASSSRPCLKCHHQVDRPHRHQRPGRSTQLLRGYNLIRDTTAATAVTTSAAPRRAKGHRPGPARRAAAAAGRPDRRGAHAHPQGHGKPAGHAAQGRPEPVPPHREDAPRVRRPSGSWPARLPPDDALPHYYNLANNDAEALKNTRPGEVPQRRGLRHRPLPLRGERNLPDQREQVPRDPGRPARR